ncbi:MAG: peptidoglycan editing factor PgeF [Verrucomicrobia bacterium]|nr:peptidoglycan editing factor PgeF [Verrucomicrobiota bacterium]
MIVTLDERCSIFFGDKSTSPISHKSAQHKNFCEDLRQQLGLSHLVRQYQVHKADGWNIESMSQLTSPVMLEEREGDFLITNQPGVGIAVLTADCLPIIFYAPQHHLVAAAHAGWRGSIAGIAVKVLASFTEQYGLDLSQVQVHFGPAARACCYEVQQDFLDALPLDAEPFIVSRGGKYFFDNSLFNKQQLISFGILPENINDHYNLCTMCNHQFCSYRRSTEKQEFKAQTTVVWLR